MLSTVLLQRAIELHIEGSENFTSILVLIMVLLFIVPAACYSLHVVGTAYLYNHRTYHEEPLLIYNTNTGIQSLRVVSSSYEPPRCPTNYENLEYLRRF